VCQPLDEAGQGEGVCPILVAELQQRLAQGLVLPQERPQAHATGIHRRLHRRGAEEVERRAPGAE
jgi:hypothetical protein